MAHVQRLRKEFVAPEDPCGARKRGPVISLLTRYPRVLAAGLLLVELFLLLGPFNKHDWNLLRGSRSYIMVAEEYLAIGGFDSAYRPPLYSLLIAGIKELTGPRWAEALFTAHVAMAFLASILVYAIAVHVGRDRMVGTLALGLFVSHILLQLELITSRETALYIVLELGFFYCWIVRPSSPLNSAMMGTLAGMAHLTRPNGLLLITAFLAGALVMAWRRKALRACVPVVAVTLIAFLAVVVPWQKTIRNTTGEWRLTSSTTSGLNLWKGNNHYTRHILPWLEVDEIEPQARLLVTDNSLTSAQSDEHLRNVALKRMKLNPITTIMLALKKGALYFAPIPIPWGSGVIQETAGAVLIDDFKPRKGWLLFTLHCCVVYYGACYLLIHRKRLLSGSSKDFLIAVLAIAIVSGGIHAITFPETRLRLPLDVLFIIGSAIGFRAILSRWSMSVVRER